MQSPVRSTRGLDEVELAARRPEIRWLLVEPVRRSFCKSFMIQSFMIKTFVIKTFMMTAPMAG